MLPLSLYWLPLIGSRIGSAAKDRLRTMGRRIYAKVETVLRHRPILFGLAYFDAHILLIVRKCDQISTSSVRGAVNQLVLTFPRTSRVSSPDQSCQMIVAYSSLKYYCLFEILLHMKT